MPGKKNSKSEQFYHENKTWERSLDFFKQENSFLKNRLSAVVDFSSDLEFLKLAEQFQNHFILKDEFIKEMLLDINIKKQTLKEYHLSGKIELDNKLIKHQGKLRNEMEYFEKDFVKLRNEFNKYLASVL